MISQVNDSGTGTLPAGMFAKADVASTVDDIINLLDADAVLELSQGGESDVDHMMNILYEETELVINHAGRVIQEQSFSGMDKFTESVNETFRCKSLNYFISDCLPDFIQSWHTLEWGNLVQIYDFLNILAARGHAKSFFFSWAYPMWKMYRYRPSLAGDPQPMDIVNSREGLLITNEYKLAIHLLGLIKTEIENNDILNDRLFPGKNTGWGAEKLDLKNGSKFIIRSANSKIRGLHPNYIIMDDFLDESSLYSQEQRDKYKDIFVGKIKPALEPNGKFTVVGTPFFEKDLYNYIGNETDIFKQFVYPAIYPDGSVLFPERWDYNSIMQQRQLLGSLVFSREFLVTPVSDASTIFPYEILRNSIRGQDEVGLINNIDHAPRKYSQVLVGCDFAISASVEADYSVFTIVGIDELGIPHVLNYWRAKGARYHEQVGALKRINQDFKPDLFILETNGMQEIFLDMLEDANLPVVGRVTGREKKSLYDGVPSMAVLFETGRIKFPYLPGKARNMTDLYFSELHSITYIQDKGKLESISEHDDSSMSLWQVINYIRRASDFEAYF